MKYKEWGNYGQKKLLKLLKCGGVNGVNGKMQILKNLLQE